MLRFASLTVPLVSASLFYIPPASDADSAVSSAGSITPATPLLEPSFYARSATLLPGGKFSSPAAFAAIRICIAPPSCMPCYRKFQPTGQMSIARVGHVAVLLRTGEVLVAGG